MSTFEPYRKELPGGLLLENTRAKHAAGLGLLQEVVFPTLADGERFKAVHYLSHLQIFPEGQFVITDGDNVIGMTSNMRTTFNFDHYQHSFKEMMAGGWMTNHDPNGDWLYGLDIGIHPGYRGRKLAKELYRATNETAIRLGLKGQVTVGMMNGYGAVINTISGADYYKELLEGKRTDPTITPQMKMGFKPLGLISNYLDDPACGNFGVLLKWEL